MDDLLYKLSEPFAPGDITWKPGATNKEKTKCLAMAYADFRAYQNRLDAVCDLNWGCRYQPWGDRIIAELTINGVTRSSVGEVTNEGEKREIGGTVAEAQGFKRACAMFGLGRYLYELPSAWVEFDAQKRTITDVAKKQLDQRYADWYKRAMAQRNPPVAPESTPADLIAPKTEPAQQTKGATTPQQQVESEQVTEQPALITETQLKHLNALGSEVYGAEWDGKRHELVKAITNGRSESSKELTEAEARRMIAGMKAKQAQLAQPDVKMKAAA